MSLWQDRHCIAPGCRFAIVLLPLRSGLPPISFFAIEIKSKGGEPPGTLRTECVAANCGGLRRSASAWRSRAKTTHNSDYIRGSARRVEGQRNNFKTILSQTIRCAAVHLLRCSPNTSFKKYQNDKVRNGPHGGVLANKKHFPHHQIFLRAKVRFGSFPVL